MKRLLWVTFLATTFLMTGCSKDDDGGSSVNSFMTFTLDGVGISSTSTSLTFPGGEDLTVNGSWAGGSLKLEVFEDAPLVEGTYNFASNQYRKATLTLGSTTYTAGSNGTVPVVGFGSITIIDIDPAYVSGEFEFETDAVSGTSKVVLNGNFKVAR